MQLLTLIFNDIMYNNSQVTINLFNKKNSVFVMESFVDSLDIMEFSTFKSIVNSLTNKDLKDNKFFKKIYTRKESN